MKPGVIYYIQNVDTGLFLDLTNTAQIGVRPKKEGSTAQQWVFEPVPASKGTYTLSSIGPKGGPGNLNGTVAVVYNVNVNNSILTPSGSGNNAIGSSWTVEEDLNGQNHVFKVSCPNGSWSSMSSNLGNFNVVMIANTNHMILNAPDNFKWKLIPVWPSIAQDIYYIQNMHGLGLQMNVILDQGKAGSKSQPRPGSINHQEWEVESMMNGQIYLKNLTFNLYLAPQRSDRTFGNIVGTKTPVAWQLRDIGGFAHAITIQLPEVTHLPLALTLHESKQEVFLAPLATNRNQFWTFDLVEPPILHYLGVSPPVLDGQDE